MKYLLVAVFFLLLFVGSFVFWHGKFRVDNLARLSLDADQSITLLFAGDIMLDRGVEYYILKSQDWKWPFLKIADVLQQADLVFANLESVISDKGTKQGSIYSFRADPRTIEGLVFAGIDVVSVANNHSFDYGQEAFLDSIERIKRAGIAPVGFNHEPVVIEVQNTKVGFLSYTEQGSPLWDNPNAPASVAWMDASRLSQLVEDVKAAKLAADIVIVSFHFGEEYQLQPNETQELLAKTAIGAGANLVVGHHPHVVQLVERYQHGWIAYSLGNFVFDQGFSKETMEGLLLKVVVQDKQITRVTPRTVQINNEFQPQLK